MYEGPIKAAQDANRDGESLILRQLRWTDLVARLAATRDLRMPQSDGDDQHASFAAFHLAVGDGDGMEDQRTVNRDALTHGKFSRVAGQQAANIADNGDRET